jgi:hypothetical protein
MGTKQWVGQKDRIWYVFVGIWTNHITALKIEETAATFFFPSIKSNSSQYMYITVLQASK